MSKVFIEETSLTAIGDAIREKTGSSDKMSPAQMVTAIEGIETGGSSGGAEIEPIVLTDSQMYGCAGGLAAKMFELFPDKISTNNLNNCSYMFYGNTTTNIPFDINISDNLYYVGCSNMFFNCVNLKKPPKFNGLGTDAQAKIYHTRNMFYNCSSIKFEADDYSDIDFSYMQSQSYAECSQMFYGCKSTRVIPQNFIENAFITKGNTSNYVPYNSAFYQCYNLDEVRNLGVSINASLTSNRFVYLFESCYCLKHFTFKTNEDGTPQVAKWKNQIIQMEGAVGYVSTTYPHYEQNMLDCAPERVGKCINSLETYELYKDDEDAYGLGGEWSLYNHDSAVETINSLPDCSATGTNTIKFKGIAGSGYGKAISNLTEDEIAVATAKGWTVTIV